MKGLKLPFKRFLKMMCAGKSQMALAKGRSPTIMTGVTGATGGLTLGKPSLLGM